MYEAFEGAVSRPLPEWGWGRRGARGATGGRKPRWLPRLGPSRLSAAHFRKGGNWICFGGAPAPPAPTVGPRGPVARFALRGVWFSTAGEWARAGRAGPGGRGARYKRGRGGRGATRSFAVPGTPRPYHPASYHPPGPGRACVGMPPAKFGEIWLGEEWVRAGEALTWTPPSFGLLGLVPCLGSSSSGSWRTAPHI